MEELLKQAKKLNIKVTEKVTEKEIKKLIEKRQQEIQKQNDDSVIINSMLM